MTYERLSRDMGVNSLNVFVVCLRRDSPFPFSLASFIISGSARGIELRYFEIVAFQWDRSPNKHLKSIPLRYTRGNVALGVVIHTTNAFSSHDHFCDSTDPINYLFPTPH